MPVQILIQIIVLDPDSASHTGRKQRSRPYFVNATAARARPTHAGHEAKEQNRGYGQDDLYRVEESVRGHTEYRRANAHGYPQRAEHVRARMLGNTHPEASD